MQKYETNYRKAWYEFREYEISNYKSLSGNGGFDHASAQSVEVYYKYKIMNQNDLASIVNNAVK